MSRGVQRVRARLSAGACFLGLAALLCGGCALRMRAALDAGTQWSQEGVPVSVNTCVQTSYASGYLLATNQRACLPG
jgi:hypothetical protein